MTTFLFWNIGRKALQATIAKIALERKIDIIALAESIIPPAELLGLLNSISSSPYSYSPNLNCTKIDIYTRFGSDFTSPLVEDDRTTIRRLSLPGSIEILFAAVHLPSKVYWDSDSQSFEMVELVDMIEQAENMRGHSRTVLFGDLNMNPFENGMVMANALHAVMSRSVAQKGMRIVNRRNYKFFYNPMWSLLGDTTPGPAGTFYYENSVHKVYFWNMFDQVVIRPELIPYFDHQKLEIIDNDSEFSLLTKTGRPNTREFSDHLPIFFSLEI